MLSFCCPPCNVFVFYSKLQHCIEGCQSALPFRAISLPRNAVREGLFSREGRRVAMGGRRAQVGSSACAELESVR